MTPRDIFISHSSDDIDAARALRSLMEEAGYTCWMAPDDIVGTETWTEQILAGIANSKAMVILVSAASNKSPHVSREVNLALGKGRAVLPVRIEDVAPGGSLEYLLSLVQRVDAFPPPVTVHRDRILRQLDTIVARPRPGAGAGPEAGADDATTVVPVAAPMPAPPPIVSSSAATPSPPPPIAVPSASPRARSLPVVPIAGVAIAAVAVVALLGSGILGPGTSPSPTTGAAATTGATSGGSSGPSSTEAAPTVGATVPVDMTADQLALRDRLPALPGVRDCVPWATPPGGEDVLSPSGYAGSIARISCPVEGSKVAARYALYPTTQALDADFTTIMSSVGVASGGACVTAIPANAPWAFPNSPNSGDLACFERDGKVQYVWTQRELGVLAQWIAPDNATGYAYWKRWSGTFNQAETDLLGVLPPTVDDMGACVRAADHYYAAALALITCPATTASSIVYYGRFPDAAAFPNDPMTQQFDLIMQGGGWPDDTSTGCYDETPTYGRYTWAFRDTSGNLGPTEGYLGCYVRTDTSPETAQYAWTYNASSVMGLWAAPDLATGISFFDAWIAKLPR